MGVKAIQTTADTAPSSLVSHAYCEAVYAKGPRGRGAEGPSSGPTATRCRNSQGAVRTGKTCTSPHTSQTSPSRDKRDSSVHAGKVQLALHTHRVFIHRCNQLQAENTQKDTTTPRTCRCCLLSLSNHRSPHYK